MDLQKINWKLFVTDPSPASPDIFFRVFNTWIPNSPEVFIDVADYSHVQDGPLTALIGYDEDYWLDAADRRLGLLYNRRTPMDGTNADKLSATLQSVLRAAKRLEDDAAFKGKLKFRTDELLFIVNDRALAPNTRETFEAVRPDIERAVGHLFGNSPKLDHLADPRRRFSVKITG